MAQSVRFWDRMAKGYAERPVPDEAVYQKKLAVTRDILRPDMSVLEFGCGTGSTALTHAPYVKQILAIDISAKMLEIAKGKAEASQVGNVSFKQATLEDLDQTEQRFDAVLGLSILHLLNSRDAAIAKVHRLLKPSGLFVSSTACLGDTMKFFKLVGPIGAFFGLIPMVRVFTEQELLDSLTAGGFAIEHHWRPGKGKSVFIVAKKLEP